MRTNFVEVHFNSKQALVRLYTFALNTSWSLNCKKQTKNAKFRTGKSNIQNTEIESFQNDSEGFRHYGHQPNPCDSNVSIQWATFDGVFVTWFGHYILFDVHFYCCRNILRVHANNLHDIFWNSFCRCIVYFNPQSGTILRINQWFRQYTQHE